MLRWSLLLFLALPAFAQLDLGRVYPAKPTFHFVAFGDYGTNSPEQRAVANAIAKRNTPAPFDIGITMGDNFYRCGVRSVSDPKWKTHWEAMYGPLGFIFYASLGNHDYGLPRIICPWGGASAQAEIDRTKMSTSWRMPAKYYTYVAGNVRFIAIDTEGWSPAQFEWIKKILSSTANEPGVDWRIVYGHHPFYTSGVHLNQRRIAVLRRDLFPVLKAAKVDLIISGHDHDMERLHVDGLDLFIAGSGGAELRSPGKPLKETLFSAGKFGFLDVEVTANTIRAQFYDRDLKPLDPKPLERRR